MGCILRGAVMSKERWKIVMLAACVVAAGVAGAWPFRRSQPPGDLAPAAPKKLDVVLRQPERAASLAPAAPERPKDPAPAVEAATFAEPAPELSLHAVAELTTAAPPELAPEYQPATVPPRPAASEPPGAPAIEPPPLRRPAPSPWRRHKIKDGDSLAKLAQAYLGDAARELEIFQANRDVLANPEILPVGRWLRIPPMETHPTP